MSGNMVKWGITAVLNRHEAPTTSMTDVTECGGRTLVTYDVPSHLAGVVFERTRCEVGGIEGVKQLTIELFGVALGQHERFGGSTI